MVELARGEQRGQGERVGARQAEVRGSRSGCGPWRRGQLPGLLREVLSPDKIASISLPGTGPSSKAKTVGGATRDPGNEEDSGVGGGGWIAPGDIKEGRVSGPDCEV